MRRLIATPVDNGQDWAGSAKAGSPTQDALATARATAARCVETLPNRASITAWAMLATPKLVLIEVLLPSVAVTRITSVPTSPLPGVPEKVPVTGLKVIQPGSGEPSARVALSVRVSPSGSLKVPAGTVKLKP
ncbi:hypothetical protein QTI90_23980 [Pectobacterium brasiliense]|nr:hypothetical protein [Pectobacterium brasiliense]WJM81185.1 hypothetical protein QTI90_23980 [Pectobacterium brasiliense]